MLNQLIHLFLILSQKGNNLLSHDFKNYNPDVLSYIKSKVTSFQDISGSVMAVSIEATRNITEMTTETKLVVRRCLEIKVFALIAVKSAVGRKTLIISGTRRRKSLQP